MAYYAILDDNNIVEQVITGIDENGIYNAEKLYEQETGKKVRRTSYNTLGGVHTDGGVPFRKNYAGIGYTYDEQRDAFIPPQPFASWVIDEDTCQWDAPIPYPQDGKLYTWNEEITQWVELLIPQE
jgi:hypothetical protein